MITLTLNDTDLATVASALSAWIETLDSQNLDDMSREDFTGWLEAKLGAIEFRDRLEKISGVDKVYERELG